MSILLHTGQGTSTQRVLQTQAAQLKFTTPRATQECQIAGCGKLKGGFITKGGRMGKLIN